MNYTTVKGRRRKPRSVKLETRTAACDDEQPPIQVPGMKTTIKVPKEPEEKKKLGRPKGYKNKQMAIIEM